MSTIDGILLSTLSSNFTSSGNTTPAPNDPDDVGETISLGERKWFIILKMTLYAIIFLISLVGNVVVCFVVCRRMKLKTVTNYFIMNLAAADLLYTICVPLDVYATLNKAWPYDTFMCRVLWPAQTLTITVSGFTLTALSVTRFWAIVNPLRRQITVKHSMIVILMLWIIATSTVIPFIRYLKYFADEGKCREQEWPSLGHRQTYTASLFVIQYAVPLTIITTCYVKIGLELTKGPTTYNKTLAKARGREARRVIKMLVIVTLTFAILTLPSSIMWMWLDFGEADKTFTSFWDLMDVLNVLDFLNSATNPIIYSFCNESFSREFRRQLGCILPNPPPSESDSAKFTSLVRVPSCPPSPNELEESIQENGKIHENEDTATIL